MTQRTIATVSLVCVVAAIRQLAFAQSPAPAGLQFEVASIRAIRYGPADADEIRSYMSQMRQELVTTGRWPRPQSASLVVSGSRVDMDGIAMRDLVAAAFGVDPVRIATGPDVPATNKLAARYVIRAVMPVGATRKQLPEMLRALLEERFHLVARRSVGEQAAYALVVAEKNGAQFNPAREIDRSACAEWKNDPLFSGAEMCSTAQIVSGKSVVTTMRTDSRYGPWQSTLASNVFRTEFFRITMPEFAAYLTAKLSSVDYGYNHYVPVVDRAGMEGAWDIVLEKTPADPATVTVERDFDEVMKAFSAAVGRVGLKLERTKAPVEQLIVDRVDKDPTEN